MMVLGSETGAVFASVVVPMYNEERYVRLCIRALLEQDYPKEAYEIILVDDGSTDNSQHICREFLETRAGLLPEVRYVRIRHSGLSVARNAGVGEARGDVIAFIDADAIADQGWLRELLREFSRDSTLGVVGGKIEVLNEDRWFADLIHRVHYVAVTGTRDIVGTNMAYRRKVFDALGGFFEIFHNRGDETAFLFNKVLPRYKSTITDAAIVYHEHPDSFRKWLEERFYNGKFIVWCARLDENKKQCGTLRGFLKQAVKLVGWCGIVAPAAPFVRFGAFHVVVFAAVALLLVRHVRRRYHLRLKYLLWSRPLAGWFLLPVAILVQLAGMLAADVGYLKETLFGSALRSSDSLDDASTQILATVSSNRQGQRSG